MYTHAVWCKPACETYRDDNGTVYYTEVLENGLQVVVGCNKSFTTSSCAVSVDVGGMDDPVEMQGLAHVVEHILYLNRRATGGTFERLLNMRCGEYNGHTTHSSTTYHFRVKSKYLKEIAAVFSELFTTKVSTSHGIVGAAIREVDSEFLTRRNDAQWRLVGLCTDMMRDGASEKRFTGGNASTLEGKDLGRAVASFVKRNHVGSCMPLVICSDLDVEYLRGVARIFGGIRQGADAERRSGDAMGIANVTDEIFRSEFVSKVVRFRPVGNKKELIIVTALTGLQGCLRGNPLGYIRSLVLDTGRDRLISRLAKRGLAYSIDLSWTVDRDSTKIYTTIGLTSEGHMQYGEVLSMAHRFLGALLVDRDEGVVVTRRELPRRSWELAKEISTEVLRHTLEEVLGGEDVVECHGIEECLAGISDASKWVVLLSDPDQASGTMVEKYYGVSYSIDRSCEECLMEAVEDFAKESDEAMEMSVDESLVEGQRSAVSRHYSNGEISFIFDSDFGDPRVILDILFTSDDVVRRPAVYSAFFILAVNIFKQKCRAEKKDCWDEFTVEAVAGGIRLKLSGPSGCITELGRQLFENMAPRISDQLFGVVKQVLLNHYEKLAHESPDKCLADVLLGAHSPVDMLEMIGGLSAKDIVISNDLFCRMVAVGNTEFDAVEDVMACIRTRFLAGGVARPAAVGLDDRGAVVEFSTYNQNNAVIGLFYRVGAGMKSIAAGRLIARVAKEEFFQAMRIRKRLGYTVCCDVARVMGVEYVSFVVMGPGEASVSASIAQFVTGLREQIRAMDSDEFRELKECLGAEYRTPPASLEELYQDAEWQSGGGSIDIDYGQKMAEATMLLTKEDLLNTALWRHSVELRSVQVSPQHTVAN